MLKDLLNIPEMHLTVLSHQQQRTQLDQTSHLPLRAYVTHITANHVSNLNYGCNNMFTGLLAACSTSPCLCCMVSSSTWA